MAFNVLESRLSGIGPLGRRVLLPKIDSAIFQTKAIQWPYVYPIQYKASVQLGVRFIKLPQGQSAKALTLGASLEFLWNQVLFFGPSYQLDFIPDNKFYGVAKTHRIALNCGIIIQLDDFERHHLLLHLRPGYSMLKTSVGNVSKLGVGIGFGYEYAFNSDFFISPEIMYYRYPNVDQNYPYGFSGLTFGVRMTFGK